MRGGWGGWGRWGVGLGRGRLAGAASSTAALGPATVQRQDAFGKQMSAYETKGCLELRRVRLGLFSASLNGAAVSSLVIGAGSSSVGFYYGDSKAGAPVVTVS